MGGGGGGVAETAVVTAAVPTARASVAGTAATCGHALSSPPGRSDSACHWRAALGGAPGRCIHYRSSAALGRSRCTPGLRPGSVHRQTLDPAMADVSLRQQASAHSLGARARAAQRSAPLDLTPEQCNTVPALVANTVGRGGRNNFPVIAVVAPVLDNSGAVLLQSGPHGRTGCGGYGAQPHVAGPIRAATQRPVLRAHQLQAQQPQHAYQAPPRGHCVGELQKLDRAALKSRLFIFESVDLELTDPSSPSRLADPCDHRNHPHSRPDSVGQFR